MRWIRRIAITIVIAVVVAVGYAASLGMEFGARPEGSLKPIETAADVKFIDANGVRFAYIEEGQGPLVLLFHGYPETARSWKAVQAKIAAAGYHVVAPTCVAIRLALLPTTIRCRHSDAMCWR